MTRPVGDDMRPEWDAYQGKISNYIQQFMSGWFIWKPQIQVVEDTTLIHFYIFFFKNFRDPFYLVIGYCFINYNNGIIDISTLNQVVIDQVFQFMKKAERAARCYFL